MTTDIWDGIPEAKEFYKSVVKNIDQYKLFTDETFDDFRLDIFATTETDAHGERFDLRALNSVADHINNRRLWAAVMHDPTIQPVGRAIAARVFPSAQTGDHVLVGVMGRYAPDRLPTFGDVGITDATLATEADVAVEPIAAPISPILGFDPNDFDEDVIVAAINESPRNLNIRTQRHFRKALDPLTIISISVSIAALSRVPFLDEFQRQSAKAFFSWLKNSLFPRICRPRRTLFEFTSEYNACRVQFVSRATTPAILVEATDHLEEGAKSAVALLNKFNALGFDKLIYEYDETAKKWLPLHAATTSHGVISNRPQLIAMDQLKEFSLGGAAGQGRLTKVTPQPSRSGVLIKATPQPSRSAVLITAVGSERTAVLELLRENHKLSPNMEEISGRYFDRFAWPGRDRTWNVLVGQPTEKGGPAAQALLHSIVQSVSPALVLMVGMCGGLPENGAKEGMVILGRQVFNYERARLREGTSVWTPTAYRSTAKVLDLANALIPRGAFGSVEVKTTKDYASGAKLIDDLSSDLRQKLIAWSGDIIAFEMEAPDLLHAVWELERTVHFDVAVVKGVSDFGDGKQRNDKEARQRAATRNAAQVALKLLAEY